MAKDLGEKLLDLIRQRRKYEIRTLEGYKPFHEIVTCKSLTGENYKTCSINRNLSMKIHNMLSDDIEIIMEKIGAKNKAIIRKEILAKKISTRNLKND